jgi:hypothetical protein
MIQRDPSVDETNEFTDSAMDSETSVYFHALFNYD